MSLSIPTSTNGTGPYDGLPGFEPPEGSPEPEDLYTRIASMLPEAGTAIAALDAERDRLRDELQQAHEALTASYQERFTEIENRRGRLAKLMRAMGQEPPEPPKRRVQAKSSPPGTVGAAKMIQLIDTILAHEGQFTPLEIHVAAGATWNQSQTYTAFRMFRDAEVIRKRGRGGERNKAWLYTLWSREAAERMKAAYATGQSAAPPQTQSNASQTVIQALRELRAAGEDRVSVQRVSEYLGRSTPKSARVVMNQLLAIGYLEEAGREGRNAHPGRDRKTFRIANEQALTTSSEE